MMRAGITKIYVTILYDTVRCPQKVELGRLNKRKGDNLESKSVLASVYPGLPSVDPSRYSLQRSKLLSSHQLVVAGADSNDACRILITIA